MLYLDGSIGLADPRVGVCERWVRACPNAGQKFGLEVVPLLHLEEAAMGFAVEVRREVLVQEGDEVVAKGLAPDHPLVVAPSSVVVGAVELAAGEGLLQPEEEGFVVRVHAECDLGLSPVAAEVAFADEDSEEEAGLEVGELGHRSGSWWVEVRVRGRRGRVVSPSSFP